MIPSSAPLSDTRAAGHWLVTSRRLAQARRGWSSLAHFLSRWKRPLLVFLLVLTLLILLIVLVSKPTCSRDPTQMRTILTGQQRRLLLDILEAFNTTLQQAGIPFFMCGGILIGSWRHHGLIPWDDDLDVMVSFASRDKLRKALEKLQPRYLLYFGQHIRWKLYSPLVTPVNGMAYSFPNLDICFYNRSATHIFDADSYFSKLYNYPQDHVFPLTVRPFEGRQLPAPRNTGAVLNATYDLDLCELRSYSHMEESNVRKCLQVPCVALQHRFPFVRRRLVSGGVCEESLMLNGTVVSQVKLNNVIGCV